MRRYVQSKGRSKRIIKDNLYQCIGKTKTCSCDYSGHYLRKPDFYDNMTKLIAFHKKLSFVGKKKNERPVITISPANSMVILIK